MSGHSKEYLLGLIGTYEDRYGRLPTRRDIRKEYGVCDAPYVRIFGSWRAALEEYQGAEKAEQRPARKGLVEELLENVSEKELKALVESTRKNTVGSIPKAPVSPTGHFKALVMGDTHIGHKKFNEGWWYDMLNHAMDEECDFAWHTGDILEGMSGRPGHVYELDAIGFEAQFDKACKLFEEVPFPIRGITGNHDLWYAGKGDMGINVGARLQQALPDQFFFLGDEEADEEIAGIKVKLWHGRDGSCYSTSYRTQKFVEGLTGGEKPHILLSGHAHKAIFHECRNVQVFETGTLCAQTGFMRGKKLAAHAGYWILEVWAGNGGLLRIKPEWNPFYKEV